MNKTLRGGKSSELIVAGELLRHGLDVYTPCVDDQAIDLILRAEPSQQDVRYYDLQVKSVKGYNRIVGLKNVDQKSERYILIIHYRHDGKADEFFYLTQAQAKKHAPKEAIWGDLVFNKAERAQYEEQTLAHLAASILAGRL